MTAPGGAPPTPSVEDDQRASIQAIILIGVAVLIGVVLLWKGFDTEGGVVESSTAKESTTTTTASASAPPPIDTTTTTAAPAANPPASVSIVVANASGGSGLAGTASTKLQAAGYTKTETSNGPVQAKSAVYYTSGAQADATAVAKALGIDASLVAAMPASPPVALNGATVLVMLGSDQL